MDLRLLHEVRGIEPLWPPRSRTKRINVSLARPSLRTDSLTALRPAMLGPSFPLGVSDTADGGDESRQGDARTAINAYFDAMEAFVSSQESVMDAYFGFEESEPDSGDAKA